ncbi:MAG: hypothetical protein LBU68_01230 [Rickettsiales bacterium]|jgi:hypothetical protein|nr:hypothetical protein [Rickettsiales bacterium]
MSDTMSSIIAKEIPELGMSDELRHVYFTQAPNPVLHGKIKICQSKLEDIIHIDGESYLILYGQIYAIQYEILEELKGRKSRTEGRKSASTYYP